MDKNQLVQFNLTSQWYQCWAPLMAHQINSSSSKYSTVHFTKDGDWKGANVVQGVINNS